MGRVVPAMRPVRALRVDVMTSDDKRPAPEGSTPVARIRVAHRAHAPASDTAGSEPSPTVDTPAPLS